MPQIPVYNERQVEGSSTIQLPKASGNLPQVDTFGALGRTAGEFSDVLEKISRKRDTVAVEKAYGQMFDEIREATYGNDGYFQKKGGHVEAGSSSKLVEDITAIRNRYAGDLKGRQVDEFGVKADEYIDRVHTSAARHESAQLTAAEIVAHEADAERFSQETFQLTGAPLAEQLDVLYLGEQAIEQKLRAEGVTDKQAIDNAKQEYSSSALRLSIDSLSEKNPALAQEKFDAVKGDLAAADRAYLEEKLAGETLTVRAQTETDKLYSQFAGDEESGMSAARKLTGELRDKVVTRLGARYGEADELEKEAYKEYNNSVGETLYTMLRDDAGKEAMLEYLDKNKTKLDDGDRTKHLGFINGQTGANRVKVSNEASRVEAMERIDKKDLTTPEQIRQQYGDVLTPGHLNEIVDYFTNQGNLGSLKRTEVDGYFTRYTNKKPSEKARSSNEHWDFIKSKLEPGRKPTSDDIRGWSLEFMERVGEVPGSPTGFLPGGTPLFDSEMTRKDAIKKGLYDRFRPWTDSEQDTAIELINKHNEDPARLGDLNPQNPAHIEAVIQERLR